MFFIPFGIHECVSQWCLGSFVFYYASCVYGHCFDVFFNNANFLVFLLIMLDV